MKIDIEKLDSLKKTADKIFLEPEGEEVLLSLLEIQKQVEDAIDAAKAKLEETALKLDPNFSSIQADKIKVYYRQYGARFKIDESKVAQIPKELYSEKVTYSPIVAEIEKKVEELGGLPDGVIEPERPKQLTFSLKDKNGNSKI